MGIFGRAKKAPYGAGQQPSFEHPSSPQYNPGVEPAGSARIDGLGAPYVRPGYDGADGQPNYVPVNHPAVVTLGFDDCGIVSTQINYGLREQPDRGGALNYAYENYELPLVQPAGAFMVARTPFRPLGSTPLQAWPTSVPTGLGLVPGQMISQPLLNPQGPDTGYDIYS